MILNSYAILDAFVVVLRLVLATFVATSAFALWRRWRQATAPADRTDLEDRGYLIFLCASLLLVLNLASWPLLYLLLQSYVPEWPGVMCIYGVTQVGKGSLGSSRYLPEILGALEVLKPIMVFVSGAWVALYLANRQTSTGPLMGRVLALLIGVGVLATIDASLEAAYLLISKKEEFVSAGCCTAVQTEENRFLPRAIVGENDRARLYAAYYAIQAVLILSLILCVRKLKSRQKGLAKSRPDDMPRITPLMMAALLAVPITAVFLIDIAAPTILHMPFHHCLYDLVPRAPESLAAVAAFVAGTFAVGWACVLAWMARHAETRAFLGEQIRKVLVFGLVCYVGSIIGVSMELVVNSPRVSQNRADLFRDAGKLSEPKVAQLIEEFNRRGAKEKSLRRYWGYDEVEIGSQVGLIRRGFRKYNPTCDLTTAAIDIADFIAKDKCRPDSVEIATELPPEGLETKENAELEKAARAVRACASRSARLRPGEHPDFDFINSTQAKSQVLLRLAFFVLCSIATLKPENRS